MPEFPDVIVYIEALSERVLNQPIQKIRIGSPFFLRSFDPPIAAAERKKVLALRRLGKRIVFELEDELYLIVHLMIAGRFHWKPKGAKIARKYGQAAFDFPNGTLLFTESSSKHRASLHLVRGEEDLNAHQLGGLDVARAIRQWYPDTKVLVLSQVTDPETLYQAKSSGAVGFLHNF